MGRTAGHVPVPPQASREGNALQTATADLSTEPHHLSRAVPVSTFYLLPPRPLLGQCFADYLHDLFPGLTWNRADWSRLADGLSAAVAGRSDVFVIHREELPEDADVATALVECFGAEAGDEVVEVRAGKGFEEMASRRWRLVPAA